MRWKTPFMLGAATFAAAALFAHGASTTSATWNDTEWDHGHLGTLDCDAGFASQAGGRVLGGSALAVELDDVVALHGVHVTHDGTAATVTPSSASPADGPNAYADPLNLTVAQGVIDADLGQGMLKLPLDNTTGVVGQYAQANSDGTSRGAAGYVTSSGAIATDPGTGYPEFASLSLSGLLTELNHDLGTLAAGITDADLVMGAVAGRADFDACLHQWSGDEAQHLIREYLASSLHTRLEVAPLGDLVTAAGGVVSELEGIVNGLASNQGVLNGLTGGLTSILNGLLNVGGAVGLGVSLGSISIDSLSATVDTTELQDFLTEPFGDADAIVEIDPGNGTVTVDIAALLGETYPSQYAHGLNELSPNTTILNDPAVITTLSSALTSALTTWLDDFDGLLEATINAIEIDLDVTVQLQIRLSLLGTLSLADLLINVSGPLGDLTVSADTENVLGGSVLGGLLTQVLGLLDFLVNSLVGNTAGAVTDLVVDVVEDALAPVYVLVEALDDLVAPVVQAVTGLYSALFLDGVVGVRVNAQNHAPNNTSGPGGWAGLPEGRYDVAALHIDILDALGNAGVDLFIARAFVGPNCPLAGAGQGCA
ncbi:MAG TPA: choice-of-anchor G family protein [Beutenbergiaceae bacterium]|nr:choice-of-anchor G family protein [Beutenbergiaceae bacterium]